ncbi:unnamed protein product [Paramecium sonneborni]|uniref:Uncharacterized protein n=1 Tax=Paramecium sonneborni TaxID=65129 RepID=A0A8S1KR24_9CILI|nr:unnamed protein product [Paramecium sonneborni]
MLLIGSKIKTNELTANQQLNCQQSRQVTKDCKSSHQLHRRYSTNSAIYQEVFKNENNYSKQIKSLLHTRFYNLHQLFKRKQYIPVNIKQVNKPFENVVTNQFSTTQSYLGQKKKKLNTREWHKVNYDKFRYLSREGSIEKLVTTNRNQNIQPCLQISQINKQQRSVSQMNNQRTESYNYLNNERCKSKRSNSLQKENLIIFLIDENQHNQKQDRIAQII